MARSSHELLIPDHDFDFDTISAVEDPLDEALMAAGAGEVTGGGIGSGWYRIEMEIARLEEALEVIRRLAERLGLPASTLFRPLGSREARTLDAAAEASRREAEGAQESGG